ncbi:hypothetical protein PF005_g17273 [Phytophthora fragariae]|uniref:Protein kinase domain-containing protein n=1 Tax=Phytophthora fragariae TaxID=53985 RepID=A0A6A3JU58_9STRA|nr:hypothetical protein PF009_g18507 [Phytophthora fragariae]KAE8996827.1 hypothetical protein PF011_g15744 [Phytophthora fragariae]KAE9094999.1 hypothetical protein PF010_g16881 [Phytophthora fragariae]KAE9095274.1 hypothetical protein PF007_g17429 [Phytophthora fragariae]KAE9128064.1 hypothetical protein PF006_g16371 [Phytophthora fragariae]
MPRNASTTKSYIRFWDTLIVDVLDSVSSGGYYMRYTNHSASTGEYMYRPNLCYYFNGGEMCVFRGEEEARGDLSVPIRELHSKLTWKYDDAPYIFGYAAVGFRVCLVAIMKDEEKTCAKADVIETYDLSSLKGRISFFLAILNISTLLRPIANLVHSLGRTEYEILSRANGVQIEFCDDAVTKRYPPGMPSDNIIRKLKMLHKRMEKNSVPNVVELKKTNMKKKHVVLMPIGLPSKPVNVRELLTALRDILEALVAMHAINLMHRDLRWENVLKYPNEDKWFLIDFDEGGVSPAAAEVNHLKAESHAPEISSSHTIKVDIWSVGLLLKTSCIHDLPPELEKMKTECLQVNPTERPTANSLLETIQSLLKNDRLATCAQDDALVKLGIGAFAKPAQKQQEHPTAGASC